MQNETAYVAEALARLRVLQEAVVHSDGHRKIAVAEALARLRVLQDNMLSVLPLMELLRAFQRTHSPTTYITGNTVQTCVLAQTINATATDPNEQSSFQRPA